MNRKRIVVTILITTASVVAGGCLYLIQSEYTRPLPGQYRTFAATGDVTVCDSAGGVVVGSVKGLRLLGDLIVGLSRFDEGDPWPAEHPGFFVIDASANAVAVGLTSDELRSKLELRGERIPELRDPRWVWGIW